MKKWLPLAFLFASSVAMAQQNPIDQQLNQCLNKESSTAGMSQCYSSANKAWDKEMNAQYSQLMKKLTGEPKDKLRNAQRAGWPTVIAGPMPAAAISSAVRAPWRRCQWAQGVSLVRNRR